MTVVFVNVKFTQYATILQTEYYQDVTQKRMLGMLPRAQKLYVWAHLSDLCEMYRLLIQQYSQKYKPPW